MKALLLAAGEGTRLRPITNTIPKCLVPINAKPLLQYWLENLSQAGIQEFLINTSYLRHQVEDFCQKSAFAHNITLSYEKRLLNTGGTVVNNSEFFNNQPFMLIHADNLCFCDFEAFISAHKKRPQGCEITMMLFETPTPKSCGIVELDTHNIVQKFHEKSPNPPSNIANGAVYICEPSVVEFCQDLNTSNIDFSNDVLPHFMGKINTFFNTTYHRDIGTLESYAMAQIEILEIIKKGESN